MMLELMAASVLQAEPDWRLEGSRDGLSWYTRDRPGASVRELKATALVDEPLDAVWAVLTDFEGWVKAMPSTEVAIILSRDSPGHTLVYLRYALPIIATRDTLVELIERPDHDGRWLLSWTAAPEARDAARPVTPDVVRLRVNEGFWQLEPRDGGRQTFVTYQLLSTPGGDVPLAFVNQVNTLGVPSTFAALQRAAHARRAH